VYPQMHHLLGGLGEICFPIRLPKRPEVYDIKGDTLAIWFEGRSSLAYHGSTFGGDGDFGQDRVELASRRSGAGHGRGAWVR
jgi:hypothetical protein